MAQQPALSIGEQAVAMALSRTASPSVFHDDADYRAVARHASGLTERNVNDIA
jgi:hypothetical protein